MPLQAGTALEAGKNYITQGQGEAEEWDVWWSLVRTSMGTGTISKVAPMHGMPGWPVPAARASSIRELTNQEYLVLCCQGFACLVPGIFYFCRHPYQSGLHTWVKTCWLPAQEKRVLPYESWGSRGVGRVVAPWHSLQRTSTGNGIFPRWRSCMGRLGGGCACSNSHCTHGMECVASLHKNCCSSRHLGSQRSGMPGGPSAGPAAPALGRCKTSER